jgi:HK97 gp10 family phage protein
MSVSVSLTGSVPPRKQFVWLRAAVKWADEVGPAVRTALKANAPVGQGPRAGRLRDSIRYQRTTTGASVSITFNAYTPYARYVIEGTRPHAIYPVAARYLHFKGRSGGDVFVGPRGSSAHVNHPGTKANPFNRRAMQEMRPYLQATYTRIMREEIGGTP